MFEFCINRTKKKPDLNGATQPQPAQPLAPLPAPLPHCPLPGAHPPLVPSHPAATASHHQAPLKWLLPHPPPPTSNGPTTPPAAGVNPLFDPCAPSATNTCNSTVSSLSQTTAAATPLVSLPPTTTAFLALTTASQSSPIPPYSLAAGPCDSCYDSCEAMDDSEDESDSVQPMDVHQSAIPFALQTPTVSLGHAGGSHSTPPGVSGTASWWASSSSHTATPYGMSPFPSTGAGSHCASSTQGVLWGVGNPTPEPMEVCMPDAASSMGEPPLGQNPPTSSGWALAGQQGDPCPLPPPPPRNPLTPTASSLSIGASSLGHGSLMCSGWGLATQQGDPCPLPPPPTRPFQTPTGSSWNTGAGLSAQGPSTSCSWGLARQQGDPCSLPPPPPRPSYTPTGLSSKIGTAPVGQSLFNSSGWGLASQQCDPCPLPPFPPRQPPAGLSVFSRLGPKST